MTDICWTEEEGKNLLFQGRNGSFKCRGVCLHESSLQDSDFRPAFITLQPVSSRGIGNCAIDIPVRHLPEVIQALQDCYRHFRNIQAGRQADDDGLSLRRTSRVGRIQR